ncbi:MAG: TPM domain-containing protein [Methylovulum sp.]|nr:TPM domain-containing protein [Methylovulum sp.]
MVNIKRCFIHTFMPPWRWRLAFSPATLKAIEQAVKSSETRHSGELRFAIENALAPASVWQGLTGRQRATEVFSNLHVWDTEENSGVLIYVLLADREVHIVADRGINRRVAASEWEAIAGSMQQAFKSGEFLRGSLAGIEAITSLLAAYFPATAINPNELADTPVIVNT